MFAMEPKVSTLHNRRRILFLLCGGVGLCATNSIGQIGYAQPAKDLPKLKTSIEAMNLISNGLASFDDAIKKITQKSGNISSADKEAIQSQSKLILSNANNVQNTLIQVISELKLLNEWNKNFDIFIESGFRKNGADPNFIAQIARQGGARAVMEKAASNISVSLSGYVEFQLKSVNITQASLMDILIPPASATYRTFASCEPWFAAAITFLSWGEIGKAARCTVRGAGCLLT
jgi:hypothetical protein